MGLITDLFPAAWEGVYWSSRARIPWPFPALRSSCQWKKNGTKARVYYINSSGISRGANPKQTVTLTSAPILFPYWIRISFQTRVLTTWVWHWQGVWVAMMYLLVAHTLARHGVTIKHWCQDTSFAGGIHLRASQIGYVLCGEKDQTFHGCLTWWSAHWHHSRCPSVPR